MRRTDSPFSRQYVAVSATYCLEYAKSRGRALLGEAVLVLAAGLALLVAGPAQAAPTVGNQAWTRTGPLAPALPQDGRTYVSAAGGQEQARAYLQIDLSGVDAAGAAASVVVLENGADGVAAEQAALTACALTEPLTVSGELTGPPPATDCTQQTAIVREGGRWVLPLAVFAERWSRGAGFGVAVIADLAVPTPFTVSFDTTKTRLDTTSTPAGVGGDPVPGAEPVAVDAGPAPMADGLDAGAPGAFAPLPADPLAPDTASPAIALRGGPAVAAGSATGVRRAAGHPSSLLIVVPMLIAAAVLWARARRGASPGLSGVVMPTRTTAKVAAWTGAVLVVATLGETAVYKLGLVGIVFIAAIGLHLLVNWCGELSLAHAGFIGVPAFAVAQFSSNSGLSPILGLPIGVFVGVALGCIVGLTALRSRGLQVALVTLAVGIAIGQFLFFRTWVVGPAGGLQIPLPSLFGLELETSRALVPLLALTVLLAVASAKAIMTSKIGRALLQVKSDPAAAAAAGVAVARHRAMAYAFAGGFAGLAGWLYVVWVQQVSAKAFPLQLGFTYLVIAALAGKGGLGGVALAALVIQGGALFSILPHTVALYLAPIALIYNVTRYQAGLNGLLRTIGAALRTRRRPAMATSEPTGDVENRAAGAPPGVRLPVALGVMAIVAGFSAMALAWYHMGNTDQVWIQNQELASGGLVGLGLIVVGSVVLIRDALLVSAAVRAGAGAAAPEPVAPALVGVPAPPTDVAVAPRRARPRRKVPLTAADRA